MSVLPVCGCCQPPIGLVARGAAAARTAAEAAATTETSMNAMFLIPAQLRCILRSSSCLTHQTLNALQQAPSVNRDAGPALTCARGGGVMSTCRPNAGRPGAYRTRRQPSTLLIATCKSSPTAHPSLPSLCSGARRLLHALRHLGGYVAEPSSTICRRVDRATLSIGGASCSAASGRYRARSLRFALPCLPYVLPTLEQSAQEMRAARRGLTAQRDPSAAS